MRPRERALYFQGMRCGHIDGKRRVGVYVQDEDLLIADDAASNMRNDYRNRFELSCAAGGYCDGYRIGASGESLPSHVVNATLPEEAQP